MRWLDPLAVGGLDYADWLTQLEDKIKTHIETYVTIDVDVLIEAELPRPFTKPIITLAQIGGKREPSGGMNHLPDSEQSYWEAPNYFVTVQTDDYTGRKLTRNRVAAELETIAFGQELRFLKLATLARDINLRPMGVFTNPGPTGDRTVYQKIYILDIHTLVPFPSLVV